MRCIDLDNNTINWKIGGNSIHGSKKTAKSTYHLTARKLLQEIYPTILVYEEVTIPIRNREVAYLDFYIPMLNMCIEVNGEQHFKYVPFFHKSIGGFVAQKRKDNEKSLWCEQNNIQIINLNYSETIDEWRSKLTS
jgi:hypothetical protein